MNFKELHQKSPIKMSLPTFKRIVLNEESLKDCIRVIKNEKRNTYLIVNEEKILNFFKA